jgi:O-6-methylguanine DNA methyltransferase
MLPLAWLSNSSKRFSQVSSNPFNLPLHLSGTLFQNQVWQGLLTIPYGTTISYAELAARIGRQGASWVVGAANDRNPIGLIIPCHGIFGANDTLISYSGGLDRKEWLISHKTSVLDHQRRCNLPLEKLNPHSSAYNLKMFT